MLVAVVGPLAPSAMPGEAANPHYAATIRRTAHGIPHILANDWGGLGFGYGYAFAQDDICVMAEQYITVDGERSKFFGPNGSWVLGGNGSVNNNLNSDFFFQQIIDSHIIETLLAKPYPDGPVKAVREGVRGYVAGYNKYLHDTGVNNLPDPACKGAAWVRPITEMDAYRRFYELSLLAGSAVAIDGIGSAQPPTPPIASSKAGASSGPTPDQLQELKARWDAMHEIGSNAYALGRDATDNKHGMVLGNPHFPWEGAERFYEAQFTIPGKVNVEGASLFGVPIVLIGHTDHLAWSHTVSTAFRFTPYELKLVPGSPTSYIYEGSVRQMTSRNVTVQVKQSDGTLKPQSRTLYSSHFGPMLTSILGLPIFPWTPELAYTLRDANAVNFRDLNHFFLADQAQSVQRLYDIQRTVLGIP
jgi:acyl-homoserine-lactone acylase